MKHGICQLSIIPVRTEPSERSEMCTQVLFGETFEIIQKDLKWTKIKLTHDSYEGWIDNKVYTSITEKYFKELSESEIRLVDQPVLELYGETNCSELRVVSGSILPFYSGSFCVLCQERYFIKGRVMELSNHISKYEIMTIALGYLDVPYLWGGRTHFGIDCSGLTQMVFRLIGKNIPRDASQQEQIGTEIVSFENHESCDLAFFCDDKNKPATHVGLILDDNTIIHASGKVRRDKIDSVGIFNQDSGEYSHKLKSIRRIL